jgi:hypothetical protein
MWTDWGLRTLRMMPQDKNTYIKKSFLGVFVINDEGIAGYNTWDTIRRLPRVIFSQ